MPAWHFGFIKFCKNLFTACTMIKKFVVACHVSTIPKSPPKIIVQSHKHKDVTFFLPVRRGTSEARDEQESTETLSFRCDCERCRLVRTGN